MDQVTGDGVVGEYPLLSAESPLFEYCSCTEGEDQDWMEGVFTFVPGSLRNPTGELFPVVVPRFHFIKHTS